MKNVKYLFLILILFSFNANANNLTYITKEAQKINEYAYTVTLNTIGSTLATGHAWIEFNNKRDSSKNTALGFYPEGDKKLLWSNRAEIIKESGGYNDSLRINVTEKQFNNALLVANYFKDTCLGKNSRGECIRWKTKNSYSLTPYNKFVCTSYANAILKAADIPVPSINFTSAKLFFQGVVAKLGI